MSGNRTLVFCEGTSDEDFLVALKQARGGLDHIEVATIQKKNGRGWGAFGSRLETTRIETGGGFKKYDNIVLLADSDATPGERFKEIVQNIDPFLAPSEPWKPSQKQEGFYLHIVLLPKAASGCLETILLEPIREIAPKSKDCSDAYFSAVAAHHPKIDWSYSKKEKLRFRLEFAISYPKEPTAPFGKIWKDGSNALIDLNHKCVDEFYAYLKSI